MKSALVTLCLLVVLIAPASAGPCDTDLQKLKTQMESEEIQADVRAQIEDMVMNAEKLCAAGKAKEAGDIIADATSMLTAQ